MANNFKRVLVKLSGEALAGEGKRILNGDMLTTVAKTLSDLTKEGTQVCVVIGAGNIWRGARQNGLEVDRVRGDHMGMLATVINSIAMQDYIIKTGVNARVMSAVQIQQFCEPYSQYKAIEYLEKGEIVILSCGVGYPFFSTDTAAALRAAEIHADAILLAKNIDGVYDDDPRKNPNAVRFDEIGYEEVLARRLAVMDTTATSLAMDNNMPVIVFALAEPENITKVVCGEKLGTTVK